jgi:hypothetical protein
LAELNQEFRQLKKQMKVAEDQITVTEDKLDDLETFVSDNHYQNIYAFGDGTKRKLTPNKQCFFHQPNQAQTLEPFLIPKRHNEKKTQI